MRTFLPLLLLGLLAVLWQAAEPEDQFLPPAPAGKTWKLVWHDEFDGDKLDESKWDVPNNRRRDGWWSPKAVSVENGHLALSTLKDGDKKLILEEFKAAQKKRQPKKPAKKKFQPELLKSPEKK